MLLLYTFWIIQILKIKQKKFKMEKVQMKVKDLQKRKMKVKELLIFNLQLLQIILFLLIIDTQIIINSVFLRSHYYSLY